MFTFKEEKEYFTRECKSKRYLMKKLSELNDEIARLDKQLKTEPSSRIAEIEYTIDAINDEHRHITERINYIDDVIAKVRDPQVRGIINALWVNGWSKAKTSQIYNFSEEHLYKKINTWLEKIFKA